MTDAGCHVAHVCLCDQDAATIASSAKPAVLVSAFDVMPR